jgi:hypothetical protein
VNEANLSNDDQVVNDNAPTVGVDGSLPTVNQLPSANEILEYSTVFGDVTRAYYGPKKNPISSYLPQRQSYFAAAQLDMTQSEKIMLYVGIVGIAVGLYQIFASK